MPQWRGSRKTARSTLSRKRRGKGYGAAMEGQSEDCPFASSTTRASVWTVSPQWRGSRKTARSSNRPINPLNPPRAAMEGQSEDCPFKTTPITRSTAPGPQWRGSRKTARSRHADRQRSRRVSRRNGGAVGRLPVLPSRLMGKGRREGRNGGAVGRLPVPGGGTAPPNPIHEPQWRGSRKTARSPFPLDGQRSP